MSAIIKHPVLGTVRGKAKDGVTQFLGIKYASLKDRLATPELMTSYPEGGAQASDYGYGPTVISPPQGCDMEFGLIQNSLPKPEQPPMSDLDGLNLNITIPIESHSTRKWENIPVLVFIHGGGFFIGSNWWPQYDFTRFVTLSNKFGSPLIAVSINYRLGVPGFLTSEELRNAGYKANNGLRDQATALRWVKQYIAGFGGDPGNVTVMGQSAGAASALTHLNSTEPLFKRCIAIAGTPLNLKPLPPPVSEDVYSGITAALGLSDLSAEERIQKLLTIPAEELLSKVPQDLPLLPVLDADIVPTTFSYAELKSQLAKVPGRKWCIDLMIGDCAFDANIYAALSPTFNQSPLASAFIASINKSLSSHSSAATSLLQAYNITPSTSDADALTAIVQFGSDIAYYAAVRAWTEAWRATEKGNVWLYHFNPPNPWAGRFHGRASHILDVAFLFQNFNEQLAPPQRKVAQGFAADVIHFVGGEAPYDNFRSAQEGKERGCRIYGGADGKQETLSCTAAGEEMGRKNTVFRLAEEGPGLDGLSAAWDNWVQGK